jgi:hypothetical protein
MTHPPQMRRSPREAGFRSNSRLGGRTHSNINIDPSQQLLGRLEGVITTGKGWRARCPAHGGKSASLAIAQGDNGTLLLHCFAGCQVHDVLAAVGLQVGDLFVRRDLQSMSPVERSQLRQAALLPKWRAALDVLVTEASVVLIGACQLGDGAPLDDTDLTRLKVAALRIVDAQETLRGH